MFLVYAFEKLIKIFQQKSCLIFLSEKIGPCDILVEIVIRLKLNYLRQCRGIFCLILFFFAITTLDFKNTYLATAKLYLSIMLPSLKTRLPKFASAKIKSMQKLILGKLIPFENFSFFQVI